MSFDAALLRVQQLQALITSQPVVAPSTSTTPTTTSPSTTSFTDALQSAGTTASLTGATATAATAQAAPTSAGQAILNLVKSQVGVAEQPPGSNDSPTIAKYRQATA